MRKRCYVVVLLAAWLAGCGPGEGAEAELRRLITDAGAAAESRDTGFFRQTIADSYIDVRGNDRDRLIAMIRGYFVANPNIEVTTRIEEIIVTGTDAARIELQTRFSGPGAGPSRLWPAGLGNEWYSMELELVLERGGWRVIGARWERPPRGH